MRAEQPSDHLESMPGLYFEQTTPDERERHEAKLRDLSSQKGLLIEPFQGGNGGWNLEIVTMDWEEPGLLDRIFEAVLRGIHIPKGITLKRVRTFTSRTSQVVIILELTNRKGEPFGQEQCRMLQDLLKEIHPGERGVLESIEHTPFDTLIPMVREFPVIDNERSDAYTFIELQVAKISNRFTNVLLHFLARSELWLNIQIADFFQAEMGHYQFFVVDKYGRKITDSHFTRHTLVRMLEEMNRMLMSFNVHYIRREWQERIDRNDHTIYHSRPNPEDFLADLENIRQMARIKGFENRLSHLVEHGLLDSKSFYFLKKVESFVEHHKEEFQAMVESTPGAREIDLCREYFEYRRRGLRILKPLFKKLTEMDEIYPILSDHQRLLSLARPKPFEPYALDKRFQLYNPSTIWIGEPELAMDPFLLMARTDCDLHEGTLDTIEAALEEWTPIYIKKHLRELGGKFLDLFHESVKQGNTSSVLRDMRQVGLLQRFLPGFENIKGMVHVVEDHAYTVDEHSFVLIEVLEGLKLLGEMMPDPGKYMMRTDYERLTNEVGLKRFGAKFSIEMRMLKRVPELSRNAAIKFFLQMMKDVRRNSLDYLMEMNFMEHGQSICLGALTEMEKIRRELDPLLSFYTSLSFTQQRNLVLAGLLHDLKKPAKDHGPLTADALEEILAQTGLEIPQKELERIGWLIRNHLEIRPLMSRMGEEGEEALLAFAKEAGDVELVRELILFTYADRVAVYLDQNKNSHDAMVLSSMLIFLEGQEI